MKTKLLRLLVVMTISITAIFALGMTTSAETTAYNIANGNINITAEGDYSISGSGTNAKITIDCSGVVNIKFENLSLKCTSYQGTMMEIKNGIVNIELDGENILQAHQDSGIYPCVSMSENAELHFYDSDSNGSITIHGTSNYYGGGAAISGGSLYVHSGSINLVGGNKIQNNYGKSFDGKVLNIEGGSLSFAGGLISSVGNGYISVSESLVIGEGASFTVSSGSTVEIMSTASATINGTLANNGSVINSGTIESKGTITGNTVGGIVNTYDFVITGGTEGEDYTYTGGVLAIIKNGATLTVANKNPSKSTTNRIEVAADISANITLAGVNIDVSGTNNAAAFKIADNSTGDVTITLADGTTNTLKSGENRAGLQKNGGASTGMLTIQEETAGTGVLNATGGDYGAGIGSSFQINTSNITISGGTVTAQGGEGAAGIGSQQLSLNYNITISGGSVKASSIGCPPTNGTNSVYLLTIANPESETVYIDGVEYTPVNHTAAEPADTNLYVYLPANTVQSPNEVTVGNETTKYTYDTTNSSWITIVDAPEADNIEFTYDGEEHTYTLAESDCYTIISNNQTAAGTYTLIVNLKENCVWSDGTTADKTYTFTIAKADPVITVTTDKPSDIAGKSIAVTTTAKHPTNEALTNIPAVISTYKVGTNGAETYFEGSFTIPEGTPNGTEIIITAKTPENENYNAATATTRVIVTDCEHTDKTTIWTSDDTSHWHVCNYCDAEVDKAEHGGGTANCVNKAVCSVCNTSYGEKDSTNHVSKSTEWTTDITGHWHNCACGKLDYAEHVSSGAATATTPETCTICGYEIAPATGDNTGDGGDNDDNDSGDGGVVTPITPPSSVKPGWGAAENVNANITTTTETSKAPVEDEEIEDEVDDDEIGVDIADEEIEDDVDDDTDTTKPADDDEDDVYDDDLVGGDDCRHDEDEEEDERVEENDDEASDDEAADNEESNVGNGIVSGGGDPNPETGVMVCFGGAIVSAMAVIISRKRKNK